jgi:regulator of protease activity HflC (stomatin/prohibitin superfamily)
MPTTPSNLSPQPPQEPTQLVQVKVPLDSAADAFATRDASGRIPVMLVPTRPLRIRNDFVAWGVGVLLVGIIVSLLSNAAWIAPPAIAAALVLFALGVVRSILVRIPEGTNGMLALGGKYLRTIGSGRHLVPPWIAVSHLVTRREIPYDVPVVEAPTRDGVRAGVDTLLTFTIVDPYRFVFRISTDDFDQVLQATCQEALRSLIRSIDVEEVMGLTERTTGDVRAAIGADMESYGIRIEKFKITYARPPEEFLLSQEQRQLAIVQRTEQAERQALAERRQADADTIEQQRLLARVARSRDALQIRAQEAEASRRVAELEAVAEELRLAKLEERLRAYPLAAKYDWESERLKVARALAGNTRAVLQVGSADEISHALLVGDVLRDEVVRNEMVRDGAQPQDGGAQGSGAPDGAHSVEGGTVEGPSPPREQAASADRAGAGGDGLS